MTSSGSPIQIGPWVGGLNTQSDQTSVADNQAVMIENLELDLDGSLLSRPPFADTGAPFSLGTSGNLELLGYYYAPGQVPFLLGSDGLSTTGYFDGSAWHVLTSTFAATSFVQFNGLAYLVAPVGSANPGGHWSPAGGFVTDPNMPKGDAVIAYKFRLWIAVGRDAVANGTTMYYSKVLGTAGGIWVAVPDFINIGAGDGQNIVQLVVYYQSILVFRTNSVYSFQFTSDPSSGAISLILPNIGLSDKDAVASFQSYLYFMYDGAAYEFVNNRAAQINTSVPFKAGSSANIYKPFATSILGSRAIFSFYDTLFVFNITTRTWTTWVSTVFGGIGRIIPLISTAQYTTAIAHSSVAVATGGTRKAKTLSITDGLTTDSELFNCTVITKNYNYQSSSTYKRLFWWGVDAVFRSTVIATVTPIVYSFAVTWGQLLAGSTWSSLLNFTWAQPLNGTLAVNVTRNTSGGGALRKFVKLTGSLWFRQVNFKLIFATDGSVTTAPVRIFSIMTYVKVKETVVQTVT